MSITTEGETIYRWRAAMKEIHRRRWQRRGSAFYRAGVVLFLFASATVSVITILILTNTL
jgi:hypothetical protein